MPSTTASSTTAYKPTLTRPSDWPAWYSALTKVANDRRPSEAVDINNNSWLPLPEVILDTFEDFLDARYPQVTPRTDEEKRDLLDNATTQQMQIWRSFEAKQLRDVKDVEKQQDKICEVKEWIRSSTAATFANLAELKDSTLQDIVRNLHALVSISTAEEVERARENYRAILKKPGKSLSPSMWLLQWQEAYNEAARLDVQEIKGALALKDFLRAVGSYDSIETFPTTPMHSG
ncbi:hypothetical protein B0T24DRAFT_704599 [Lasiosphaeria ovina]|uniref:Uncharacterized protein n=1 Tax=Lasiosphaeria ovina TaxID=92902 RepID=A0AAE0KCZ0_9PEZI|nr:hypothetical protein B0T24DRAFT_704599 [Lasiosphaeria ovina]